MPVAKLGQSSSNEVSDLQQKHWDVDQRIRDILSAQSLDVKMMLSNRLAGICEEMNTEMVLKKSQGMA